VTVPRGGSSARRDNPRRWRLVRARGDAVPASVRRFTARARQRRLHAARPWLAGLGVLALLGAVAVVVSATPLFGVAHIRVLGAHLVTEEQVRQAAGVPAKTPLIRVDRAEVTRRVGALPPVRQATVSRRWPQTLVIEVVERTGVATVRTGSGFAVLDASGLLFATLPARPPALPLLRLASPGRTDPSTRSALLVLAALTGDLRGRLVELVADAPTRIRLELSGGKEIIWGDATENETKSRVATSLLNRPGKVIDVSAPTIVTVR
jgi:cell division protein FtsQ